MPEAYSPSTLDRRLVSFVPAMGPTLRLPEWTQVENAMARALDAIRHYARIAWWDGSSVGLHLHGLIGMFGALEPDPFGARPEDRR